MCMCVYKTPMIVTTVCVRTVSHIATIQEIFFNTYVILRMFYLYAFDIMILFLPSTL